MKKSDELSTPTSCINIAKPEEWVFVLIGRDVAAPASIRFWCHERVRLGKNVLTDPQITEAFAVADAMETEQKIWKCGTCGSVAYWSFKDPPPNLTQEMRDANPTKCASCILDTL